MRLEFVLELFWWCFLGEVIDLIRYCIAIRLWLASSVVVIVIRINR